MRNEKLRNILDPADVHGPDFASETFRVLKEKETAKFGEYRTRRLLLDATNCRHAATPPRAMKTGLDLARRVAS